MPTTATVRLSLAMIVRDEARSIERCLRSVTGVVDEIVVVDTGSVDDTVARATAAGARVHHVAWTDDFAAARNASLERCTGVWRLVLDADEWLAGGADELHRLAAGPADAVGLVAVESATDDGGTEVSWQPRLLPAGVRYRGLVHEQPDHDGPHRQVAVRVGHDGYLAAQQAGKRGRNARLLAAALDDDPGDAYLRYQLGRDHEAAGRWEEAAAAYEAADALRGPTPADPPGWHHALVTRRLWALTECGRTQEAVDLAQLELPHWEGSADFLFGLGVVLLRHAVAHPEVAGQVLPMVEQSWQRCLELGDGRLPGSVTGRGSHLAAHNLVVLYEGLGRPADADRYRAAARPPRP